MNEIESIESLELILNSGNIWSNIAVQGLDLRPYAERLNTIRFDDCLFLGCELPSSLNVRLVQTGNAVFPRFNLPFKVYRNKLYNRNELFEGFGDHKNHTYKNTLDARIYHHYLHTGGTRPKSIRETLARRLHDHAISDALGDLLRNQVDEKRIVAVMGGHMMQRNSADYLQVARFGKLLADHGYLPVSGGGPGAMEAVHFGASFVSRPEADMESALKMLGRAPDYEHPDWLGAAFDVINAYGLENSTHLSIGIPTWMYGHEPPNPFASHIAKYFDNSVREESLLAMAKGGVVYARGSAGTIQEIFQDACQNHYETFGMASPMIFLDRDYWIHQKPVFPLLKQLAEGKPYAGLLFTADSARQAFAHIRDFAEYA